MPYVRNWEAHAEELRAKVSIYAKTFGRDPEMEWGAVLASAARKRHLAMTTPSSSEHALDDAVVECLRQMLAGSSEPRCPKCDTLGMLVGGHCMQCGRKPPEE